MLRLRFSISFAIILVWLCSTAPVEAHAVGTEAKLKNGTVTVEVFYDDNTPGSDAKIQVENGNGEVVHQGVADNGGLWSFPVPAPGRYVIKVDAGAGHHAKTMLTVPDVAPAVAVQESDSVTISEGPTRFTGWKRIAIAVLGVASILGGTWVISRVLKLARLRQARDSSNSCPEKESTK